MEKMKISPNMVAVRPIENDFEWKLDLEFDEARHLSVYGRVEIAPSRLDCMPAIPPFFADQIPDAHLYHIQLQHEFLIEPADIEVEAGDEVLFSYQAHLLCQDEGWIHHDGEEKVLVMPYSLLNFNISTWHPLNGFIFVEPIGVEDLFVIRNGFSVYYDMEAIPGVGRIVYGPDKGQMIHFNPIQVAPEYKYHQRMNPGGLPLLRIPSNEIIEVMAEDVYL